MADRVNVINPTGELVSIPAERAELAQQAGYRLATDADLETYAAKERWGDRPIEAMGAGAFGWLVGGPKGRETIENLEKYNPGAAITGTIASYLAPGAIVRGARALPLVGRLAGPAAAGALAPQLGINALGQATERYLTSKLAQGAVTLGTRGLVEGAAVGGFDYLDEVALGDDVDFNAEQLWQAMEGGALLGGATGAGMGALISGVQKAGRGLLKAGKPLQRKYAESVERISGGAVKAEDVETLFTRESYEAAQRASRTRASAFDETLPKIRQVVELQEDAFDMATRGVMKENHIHRAMPENIDIDAATGYTAGVLQELNLFFQAMEETAVEPALKRAATSYLKRVRGGAGGYEGGGGLISEMLGKMEKATSKKAKGTALFLGFDKIKRHAQETISRNLRKLSLESDEANIFFNRGRELLKNRVEPFLEDGAIWGQAADVQRLINKPASELIDARTIFEKYFTTSVGTGDYGQPVTRMKDSAWQTYINQGLRKAKGDLHEARVGYFDGLRKYANELKDNLHLGPNQEAKLNQLLRNLDEIDETLGVAKKETHLEDLLKGVEKVDRRGREESYLGMVAGGLAFGRLGTAASLMTRPMAQPGLLLHTYHRLSKSLGRVAENYDNALNTLNAKSIPRTVVAGNREYEEASEHVRELPQGEALAETLLQNMPEVTAVAPDHVFAMANLADRQREFLLSRMPISAERSVLGGPPVRASKTEAQRWLETVKAVNAPVKLLEDLAAARLSMHTVRAIQAMYPKWFDKFAKDLTNEVIDMGQQDKQLPYDLRIQASMVLDTPLDPMLSPSYLIQMRNVYSDQGLRQRAQSSKRVRGQPDIAQFYPTGSEETQNAD